MPQPSCAAVVVVRWRFDWGDRSRPRRRSVVRRARGAPDRGRRLPGSSSAEEEGRRGRAGTAGESSVGAIIIIIER